jgi:hypothetical protein
MLVHDDNAEFPYKDAYVHAIKAAFDAMLRKRAGLGARGSSLAACNVA